MKRFIALLLVLVLCLALFAGCKKEEEVIESESESESSIPEPEPEPKPVVKICNPLTGESGYDETKLNKRPFAIMINNIDAALPQYGIGCADIMFEIPVEGSITRMMAIYADYTKVPDVCTIRSCRYYYPIFALGFDAIYSHWGLDKVYAGPVVNSLGVDRIDGGVYEGDFFQRDQARLDAGYAWEHTGYLEGEKLADVIENRLEFRTEKKDGYETAFKFNDDENPQTLPGGECKAAVLDFSGSYFSTFTYDEAKKVYLKQHSGDKHIDQSTGEQLAFTNVFALETDIGYKDDNYHRSVDWTGGTGYYISNGSYMEINWSKADEYSPIIITDKSGNEVTVNAGKSFIGVINPGRTTINSDVSAVSD